MTNTKRAADQDEKNALDNMEFENIINNNMIENTLLSLAENENINIYDCKISQFKALLINAGALLFPKNKNILKIKTITHVNNNIPVYSYIWDIKKLAVLCDIYLYISYKYNKIISFSYFSFLCNSNYINMFNVLNNFSDYNNIDCRNEFNNLKTYIIKRLKQDREEYIKESCLESSGAIGKIAVANTEFGWSLTPGQKAITTAENNIISIQQLPTLKAIDTVENGTMTE